jgi:hypothetical protein
MPVKSYTAGAIEAFLDPAGACYRFNMTVAVGSVGYSLGK